MKITTISIIVPCFNEVETIEGLLSAVFNVHIPYQKEIIIVDDCSTDGSFEIIGNYRKNSEIKIFRHDVNQGKGAALRTGISHAMGDIIIIQDADLEYDPNEYPNLIKPFVDGVADVVYGSRFKGAHAERILYFWHSMGNKFLTLFSNMMTNLNLTDMETCYKVFRRDIIQNIEITEDRFGFEPEVTAKISAYKPRLRIYEVGISYYGRTYEEGKKINWKDGVAAIWCILKYNLWAR
jgi:glycosyltransferase involved in cell wall biosynthesis